MKTLCDLWPCNWQSWITWPWLHVASVIPRSSMSASGYNALYVGTYMPWVGLYVFVHGCSRCNTNYRLYLCWTLLEWNHLHFWPHAERDLLNLHIDGQYGVGTVTNWGTGWWPSCCGDRDRECPLWRRALVAAKWFMGSSRKGCCLRNIGKQSILLNISCTHDHVYSTDRAFVIWSYSLDHLFILSQDFV